MNEPRAYTFVLKLTDRPGAMELIAATFAHRGLSLSATLGNDSSLSPDGHATVLIDFRATPARKEALKATLSRLSRVLSLTEHAADDPAIRRAALVRLAADTPAPAFPPGTPGTVERVTLDPATNEPTYALLGPAPAVAALLEAVRAAGHLRAVTQTVLAL